MFHICMIIKLLIKIVFKNFSCVIILLLSFRLDYQVAKKNEKIRIWPLSLELQLVECYLVLFYCSYFAVVVVEDGAKWVTMGHKVALVPIHRHKVVPLH